MFVHSSAEEANLLANIVLTQVSKVRGLIFSNRVSLNTLFVVSITIKLESK